MYDFKDEFKTGNVNIDEEHRKLFEIADRAYVMITDEFIPDKYDYIVEIINELRDYAATHFQHEEEYMISIGYRRLISHKAMHQEFVEKLNGYSFDEVDEKQKEVMLELLEFLNDWLISHILKNDTLIG